MRKYIGYLLGINILVILLLLWMVKERLHEFEAYHLAIAQESTSSASRAIAGFIAEKKRLVSLFATENPGLINQHAADPYDSDIKQRLSQRIATHFPDYFTFAVSDAAGVPVAEDFEGYVGDLCKLDLEKFASSGQQFPRIHPNHEVYHFDILAPLKGLNRQSILFISFHADVLGKILESAQTQGHQLILIDPTASHLIEVTSDGARINWERNDYRLSEDEKSRILFSNKVSDTVWEAVDLSEPELFSQFKNKLILHSLLIAMLFILVSIAMLIFLTREEKLRKKAERNKENFLAVVSHDIRTPITSIRGSLDLIKNGHTGELTAETLQYINIAVRNSERLVNLIDDLLDLQKIEAGEMNFNIQAEELTPLVSACIENNTTYAKLFNASCRLQVNAKDLIVSIDASRFDQAFSNMLSNAIKYGAPEDEILISIDRHDFYARVSVTDHGAGIPESKHQHVFSRFTQFGAEKSGQVKGTGLGLSIVKNIIEKQGGRVGFTSVEGEGSTFFVDLPIKD